MSTGAHSSMPLPRRVTVRRLVEPGVLSVGLRVLAGAAGLDREIAHPRIQKSGLGLVGHFEGISSDRVQVLERLVTDDDRRLSREIDGLRDRRPPA